MKSILISFFDKNIQNFLILFLQLSSEIVFCELFTKLFKLILKLLQSHTKFYCESIIDTIFKIFQLNPKRNSFILNLFSFLLTTLDHEKNIGIWLNTNYSQFNLYLMNMINQSDGDPDLIKYFVEVQARIFLYDESIFFGSESFDTILKEILKSFVNISEYGMTKEIVLFLNTILGAKRTDHPSLIKFVPDIINAVFFTLPEINRNFLHYVKFLIFFLIYV